MPELPEVETVKNVLKPILIGQTITRIDVLRKSTIVGNVDEFISTLTGATFLDITRIGKFLIFHLNKEKVFISHLRMEGKYFEVLESEDNTKYARVIFHLSNNHKICYDDSRCFGMMKLSNESSYKELKDIASLGPEAFDINDPKYLYNKYEKISRPIKSTLLDQNIMTGLGNIYADEVLFASKIHPLTPANLVTLKECEAIIDNSKKILAKAIEEGGSTIKSYHPGKDIDGNFQVHLLAYGRASEECHICHTHMRFKKVGGRGSTYCPKCQIKKGAPIKVAIYGQVASGKSQVLDCFVKNNIPTLSCDDIVHELYNKQEVITKIQSMFNMEANPYLDIKVLRNIVSKDIKNKKKLERYIHPLVKKEVKTFLEQNKDILVVEVPLLFEAKFTDLFDYYLVVDTPNSIRLSRLENRNANISGKLETINKNPLFEQYKKEADFIVINDKDIPHLNKQVNEIINILKTRLK